MITIKSLKLITKEEEKGITLPSMTINTIQNTDGNENNNLHDKKKYDMLRGNDTKRKVLFELGQISNKLRTT